MNCGMRRRNIIKTLTFTHLAKYCITTVEIVYPKFKNRKSNEGLNPDGLGFFYVRFEKEERENGKTKIISAFKVSRLLHPLKAP